MKNKLLHFFTILLSLTLFANNELPEIRQITTHPEMDYQPAVSSDGRWLAFVSRRSGNLDIWVKPLPSGRAFQITKHQAEDYDPAWSPDGKKLVFVSKRRDALGDIWAQRFDPEKGRQIGKPWQLTQHLGLDRSPSFSPAGSALAYVSDESGQINIHIYRFENSQTWPITREGGFEPAWSPADRQILFTSVDADGNSNLSIVQFDKLSPEDPVTIHPVTQIRAIDGRGAWSPDGSSIVFQRIHKDLNGDGVTSPEDPGSIWEKDIPVGAPGAILEAPEIQLTVSNYSEESVCWPIDSVIYFTSTRGGDRDVWSMPAHGLIPRMPNATAQYMAVFNRFGYAETQDTYRQAVLGYERVIRFFTDDSMQTANALIRQGENYTILKEDDHAIAVFERIIRDYPQFKKQGAEARVKAALIESLPLDQRIGYCRKVIRDFADQQLSVMEARLMLGDLLRRKNEAGESLAEYSDVANAQIRYTSITAQARLKIGDLLDEQDDHDLARQSYFAVLREFGQTPLWRQRATDRIMAQVTGSLQDRIQSYQAIQQQAADLPSLVAETQLAIGEALMQDGQHIQAIRELEQVRLLVPSLRWADVKSRLMQARAYHQRNDFLKSKYLLEEILEKDRDVEGGLYEIQARTLFFDLSFKSAEQLRENGDFALAMSRYQIALGLQPEDVQVHRGLIESAYYWQRARQNGKLDSLIVQYASEIRHKPDNAVLLYSMGLALSYQGEHSLEGLAASNRYLLAAMEQDYRMIYPYRTMGYNYEVMELLAQKKQDEKASFLEKTGKVIFTPFRWVANLFSREEDKTIAFYEKAIEVLTTAIELNDVKTEPRLEAELAQNLANNFYNLGEYGYAKAYQYYRQRLSLDTTFARAIEQAIFYERAGHCGIIVEDAENAELYLVKAIKIYQDAGRDERAALNRRRLALFYQLNERYPDAIVELEKIVSRDERLRQWDNAARGYRNIAYNYHLLWEPEDAIRYAKKAEQILATQKIPKGPPEKSYLRWEIFGLSIPIWGMEEIGGGSAEGFGPAEEVALVFSLISQNSERIKDFSESIRYEKKRFQIFKDRKDKAAQRICLNRLGMLEFKLTQYNTAWNYFFEAYKRSEKQKDDPGRWINAMNMVQIIFVELSDSAQSSHLKYYTQVFNKEKEQLTAHPDSAFRDMTLNTIRGNLTLLWSQQTKSDTDLKASIQQSIQRLEALSAARGHFESALQTAMTLRAWRQEGVIRKSLAEIALKLEEPQTAVVHLRRADSLMARGGETGYLWRIRYSMANAVQQLSPAERRSLGVADPLKFYLKAIDGLEQYPVTEEESELRLSDRKDRWSLYLDAAVAFADDSQSLKALEILERGRQKQVADMLSRRPPDLRRRRHDNAWRYLRDIKSRIGALQTTIYAQEARHATPGELQSQHARIDSLYAIHTEVKTELQYEDEVLAYLAGAFPVSMDGIRNQLTDEKGALGFWFNDEDVYIYTMDNASVDIQKLSISKQNLKTACVAFTDSLQADCYPATLAKTLSNVLLQPIFNFVDEKHTLILIPDDFLWQIPFEALTLDGDLLIDRCGIVYTPSLTTYQLAAQRKRINQQKLLLVGDILTDQPTAEVLKADVTRLGPDASETHFRADLQTADLAYCGRWIVPNENSPLMASLVLYVDDQSDGYVRAEELYSWDASVSMIRLPSTGPGLAWQSMHAFYHALLYAGVPSLVFTRWPVDRANGPTFFKDYYQRLDETNAADAMAMSQADQRNQNKGWRTWTATGLMGFEGMDRDARIAFARSNLVSTVLTGRAYIQMGEYRDAIQEFERALRMAVFIEDTTSMRGAMNEIIRAGMAGELWDKAIAYQQRQAKLAEATGDTSGLDLAHRNLITFYYRSGQFEEASKAKISTINNLKIDEKWDQVASACVELAIIYASARDYESSITWADEGYRTYISLEDNTGKARALIWKGRSLLDAERFFQAKAVLSLAIEILKSMENDGSRTQFDLASALQLRGVAYEKLSLYPQSLEDQKHALAIYQRLDRPLQIAQGYQYLANVAWKMGQYRDALDHQNTALKGFREGGHRKQLAMANSTLGLIQMSLGNVIEAKASQEKALSLAESIQSLEDQATILKNMGQIAIQQNALNEAFSLFGQAAAMDSTINSRLGLAYDQRNQGMLLHYMHETMKAVPLLKRGLGLSKEIGDLRNQVQCYYGLAVTYQTLHEYNLAIVMADSGLVLLNQLVAPELSWRLHRARAQSRASQSKNSLALADYEAAVTVVEAMRAELKIESYKQGFFDDKMDLYVDMIQLFIKMNQPENAFYTVERAKSRNFIDMLANQSLQISGVHENLLEGAEAIRIAIQETQEQIAHFERQPVLSISQKAEKTAWQDSLDQRRQAYTALITEMQLQNPELTSFVSVNPWTADEVMSRLPEKSALIEYFIMDRQLLIWVIRSGDVQVVSVDLSKQELVQAVQSLREGIQSSLSVDREAAMLNAWLIAPIHRLEGIEHLIIVPHGVLHYLPFAVLQDVNLSSLIERYSLSIAPSATVLGYCIDKGGPMSGDIKVLAFGNPDLNNPAMDLEFAEKEVLALRRTFNDVTAWYRKDVNEPQVQNMIGDENIIHFACHAVYEPKAPLFSALLLSPTEFTDGRLEAQEIFNLKLNCDLVSLSACETGLAQVTEGDEIIGLARSFVFAGTPSILTSLWKVDDLATAVMVKRFYRYLGAGDSRAVALQKAQLVVKNMVNPHPSAWAAFQLTGDFR